MANADQEIPSKMRKIPHRAPCFLEVFLPSLSSHRLKLPLKFVWRMEGTRSGLVSLMGPSGNSWGVDLVDHEGDLYLENGWEAFVEDHSLQCGDSLVFRYDGGLHFTVQIFDESACEKEKAFSAKCSRGPSLCHGMGMKRQREEESPFSSVMDGMSRRRIFTPVHLVPSTRSWHLESNVEKPELANSVSNTMTREVSVESESDGSGELNGILMDEISQKSSCSGAENGIGISTRLIIAGLRAKSLEDGLGLTKKSSTSLGQPICRLKSNGINKEKPKKTIKEKNGMSRFVEKAAAKHFTSEFPFFVRVMNFSNVAGNGIFKLPAHFSTDHLPKIRTKVVIWNLKGECWTVTSIPSVRSRTVQHIFCAGWRAFVRDNSIKMGDVCIFEKVGDCELRAHTLRLGLDEVGSYSKKDGSGGPPLRCAELSSKDEKEIERDNFEGDCEERTPVSMSVTKTQNPEALSSHMMHDYISLEGPVKPIPSLLPVSSDERTGELLLLNTSEAMSHDPDDTSNSVQLKNGGAQGPSMFEETSIPVSLNSSFPSFMKVMKYYNTSHSYVVHVPCKFAAKHLPQNKTKIVLRNMQGQCWIVNSMPASNKSRSHMISGGWCKFVRGNNIKTGDRCVFELVGEKELRVQTFGARHGVESQRTESMQIVTVDLDPREIVDPADSKGHFSGSVTVTLISDSLANI
ncbi:B3 domain-containing protein [Drosera capensis]